MARGAGPRGDPVAEVAEVFEAAGVRYAFTGAIALGYWGIERASKDVDVVVYGGRVVFATALNRLADFGFALDPVAALKEATDEGHTAFAAPVMAERPEVGISVDLILPVFQAQARRQVGRAVRVPWFSRPGGIMVISAEDLVVHKLIFFRRTEFSDDPRDIEAILRRQKGLDVGYVLLSIGAIYPETDPRLIWFRDALVRHGFGEGPRRRKRKRG